MTDQFGFDDAILRSSRKKRNEKFARRMVSADKLSLGMRTVFPGKAGPVVFLAISALLLRFF